MAIFILFLKDTILSFSLKWIYVWEIRTRKSKFYKFEKPAIKKPVHRLQTNIQQAI